MIVKILHTGDLHLGAKFTGLGEKGKEQRLQLLKTFEKVVNLAIEKKVHLFLIAGDLFDSNYPSRNTLDRALHLFGILREANIPICLIPGTHDCYDATSIYRRFDFREAAPNLTIFTDKITSKVFEKLNLTVYGRALTAKVVKESPLKDISPQKGTAVHVAMVHGSLEIPGKVERDGATFTPREIEKSRMNYIAMGHWHSYGDYSVHQTKACYCGSPEAIDIDQKGFGNVLFVTIKPDDLVKVEPQRVGLRNYEVIHIKVDDITSVGEILEAIKAKADPNLILEVKLQGLCGFDLEIDTQELEQELEPLFFRLRMINESHPKLKEIAVEDFPENMVIGKFIRLMKEKIKKSAGEEKEIAEEALRLGVALLRGKEVL